MKFVINFALSYIDFLHVGLNSIFCLVHVYISCSPNNILICTHDMLILMYYWSQQYITILQNVIITSQRSNRVYTSYTCTDAGRDFIQYMKISTPFWGPSPRAPGWSWSCFDTWWVPGDPWQPCCKAAPLCPCSEEAFACSREAQEEQRQKAWQHCQREKGGGKERGKEGRERDPRHIEGGERER